MIVDDEKGIRDALKQVLEYEEIEGRASASGHEAMRVYPDFKPHLVFLDVKMRDGRPGTLKKLRELNPRRRSSDLRPRHDPDASKRRSSAPTISSRSRSITDRILLTLRNALQHVVLVSENVRLKQEVGAQYRSSARASDSHVIGLSRRSRPRRRAY